MVFGVSSSFLFGYRTERFVNLFGVKKIVTKSGLGVGLSLSPELFGSFLVFIIMK